jgi:hypothetical protein
MNPVSLRSFSYGDIYVANDRQTQVSAGTRWLEIFRFVCLADYGIVQALKQVSPRGWYNDQVSRSDQQDVFNRRYSLPRLNTQGKLRWTGQESVALESYQRERPAW